MHTYKGKTDNISLSASGSKFLKSKHIPDKYILGEIIDKKWTDGKGTYHSEGECETAVKIFKDIKANELHCICSPAQMERKILKYIDLGYVPFIYTVSCDDMFHDYIYELFIAVPKLINSIKK